MSIEIAPAILGANHGRLAEAVMEAGRAGADLIHLDIMDGHFAPAISFGVQMVRDLRPLTDLPFEVHLMVDDPDRWLDDLVAAGADIVAPHVESCRHLHTTVRAIQELGARAEVAINPATPLALLEDAVPWLDGILVMTVDPGTSGMVEGALAKLRRVREMATEAGRAPIPVVADGGIDLDTAGPAAVAGASRLVAASAVFASPDGIESALYSLRSAAASGAEGREGDPSGNEPNAGG